MRDCNKCQGPGFDPTEQAGPVYLGGVLGIDVNGVRQPIDADGIVQLPADAAAAAESAEEAAESAAAAEMSRGQAAQSATDAAGSATQAAGSATAAAASAAAAQTAAERDVPAAAAAWLSEHVDPSTGYVLDDSLTIQGAAADAKAAGDEIDTNSILVNGLGSLIDYGYDTPYERIEVPGGTWKTAIGVKRIGPRVILNRSAVGSAQVFIKLSGAVDLYSTNASVDAWTGGVSLISGHKYRAECKLVSGESILDEDVGQRPPSIQVIKPGAHTSVGEYTATSTTTTVDFTAESGATYNIALFMGRNKYTFANAVLLVTLTDLTDNQVYQLQEAVEALEDEQSGAVPDYYMADDYLPNRAKAVNEIAAGVGRRSVRTIFFTDYHLEDNARVSPVLMRYLIGHTTIRNVIFGGDAYNHDYTSKAGGVALLASFARDFSAIREAANFYGITGNHEMNNADLSHSSSELSPAVAYNLFNEPISYKIHSLWPETNTNTFYIDDEAAQIRYYGIDCGSGALIPIGVIRAIAASFATVPDGYAVVLFSHTGIAEYTIDDTVTPPVRTATALTDRIECIMECAAALNDGLTKTVQITISGTTYNVQCNYSGKARTVVGAITGHRHIDTYYIYDGRFPVIATACDTGAYRDTMPLRVAGTITEQAFDIVQIDIATKRIYCTRIGAGADRTFSFGDGAGPIEV